MLGGEQQSQSFTTTQAPVKVVPIQSAEVAVTVKLVNPDGRSLKVNDGVVEVI